jgi:hypothetical protein
MGFKFKSLHISAFAVIVAIILGLAYMLYRRYSNSKEGFENATTTIVSEDYYTPDKQAENVNEFFKKYGVAPYTDKYTATNLLDIDQKTFIAFINKYGMLNNLKNEEGQMLWPNESTGVFLNKIGFDSIPGSNLDETTMNGNFYIKDPTDKKIYILDDDEMAKKIFSQFTTNKDINPNGANRTSSGMKRAGAGTMTTTPQEIMIPMPMPNNSGAGQDNYNHFNGTSIPTMFYGPNGSTAKISNQGGAFSVIVTDKNGTNVVYDEQNKSLLSPSNLAAIDMVIDKVVEVITRVQKASSSSASTNASPTKSDSVMKYYGPNGSVALMYTDSNGNTNLKLIDGNGREVSYSSTNTQSYNPSMDNPNVQQTMGSPTSPNKMNVSSNYNEAYTQSLTSNDYSSSLPKGIPRNMIPPGNEDLYILKSEVVPPVCPACPPPILKCNDDKPPPPCPPCARCPEPRFDCKKVPNYGSGNLGANYFGGGGQFGSMPSVSGNFLPYPSVSNYSTFGN